MRPTLLGLVVVLTACGDATSAVDDGVTDGAANVLDASADTCPRARDPGVLRADWNSATGCGYICAPDYYACNRTRTPDGFLVGGECLARGDANCAACGNACGAGTHCRVSPQGAQFGYACLP